MTLTIEEKKMIENVLNYNLGEYYYIRYNSDFEIDEVRVRVKNERFLLNVLDKPNIKETLLTIDVPRVININIDFLLVLKKLTVSSNYVVYVDYTILRELDIERIKNIEYVMNNILYVIEDKNLEDTTFMVTEDFLMMTHGKICKDYNLGRGVESTYVPCYKWGTLAEQIRHTSNKIKGKSLILDNVEEFNESLGLWSIEVLDEIGSYVVTTEKIYTTESNPKFLVGNYKGVEYKFKVQAVKGHFGDYGGYNEGNRNIFLLKLL